MNLLDVCNVKKVYGSHRGAKVTALNGVSFSVNEGEFVAIMGESGSGKSTLLNLIASFDRPTEGEVFLKDEALSQISDSALAGFRRDKLGFVFQDFHLLERYSVRDNILLPLVLSGTDRKKMEDSLQTVARLLNISDLLARYPYEISGGQKQRTAIGRAIITEPELILADEPTGALDSKASDDLMKLFDRLNGAGQTILMVTHSLKSASFAGRVLFIRDGQIYNEIYRGGRSRAEFMEAINETLNVLSQTGAISTDQTE